jgi:hypothetical protein
VGTSGQATKLVFGVFTEKKRHSLKTVKGMVGEQARQSLKEETGC